MADDVLNSLYKESVKKYKQLANSINDEIVKNSFKFTKDNKIKLANDGENTRSKKLEINEMLSYFKLEQEKITSINKQRQDYEINLQKFKIKNQVESFNLERDMISKQLNNYKNIYKESFNEKSKFIKKNEEAELKIYESALNENRKLTDAEIKQVARLHREKNKYIEQDTEYQIKQQEKAQNEIERKSKERIEAFGKYFSKVLEKILNFGLDTFIFNRFKSGIENFSSYYEQNFTEIAGRTGSNSRRANHNFITGTLDNIMSNEVLKHGLNFNKDVFPEITNAVKNGFQGEEAQSIAITNAIDKKIMPWLETTSETWVQLQYNINDDSLNQIKGTQLLLQETREGNRLLQSGVINEITSNLVPTLQAIDANTVTKESLGATYEILEQLMAGGMDRQSALKMTRDLISADQNTFDALTSGDPAKIIMGIGAINGGGIPGGFNSYKNTFGSLLRNAKGNEIGIGAINSIAGHYLPADYDNFADLIYNVELTGKYNSNNANIYNNKKSNLRENVTRTQDYDNNMENIATNTFDGWAMFPHGMEMINGIVSEVRHISHLLTALVTVKAGESLTNFLGKNNGGTSIISKLLTGGNGLSNALIGGEIVGNSVLSGSKKLGFGLKNAGLLGGLTQGGTQLTGGLSGGLGSTAIGTAAVAGGALMVFKGGSMIADAITNKNNETTGERWGTGIAGAAALGGGGMLATAGLGLASGPVGWAGLLIGGAALAGKALYDNAIKIGGASAAIDKAYEEQKESIRKTTETNINNLTNIFNSLNDINSSEKDVEEQRNNLIKSGLLTQKDEEKARNANKDQLKELTKAYLMSTESFRGDIEAALDKSKSESKAWSNSGWSKMVGQLNFYDRYFANNSDYVQAASGIMDTIYSDLEKQKQNGELGKSEQHIYDAIESVRSGGYTSSELSKILHSGWIDEHLRHMSISSPEVMKSIQTKLEMYDTDISKAIVSKINSGPDKYHDPNEEADALNYLINAINVEDKDAAIKYLNEFKEKGYKLSAYNDQKEQLENKWGNEIYLKGYSTGSSYIQYDQIAQLHAGERVLTANQNKDYTENLVGSGSSTGIIEAGVRDLISAIQDQTKTILDYLSSVGSNTFSYSESSMSMLPRMGNTRVVF